MKKKILLVEDEALIAMNEAQMLKKHGYEVVTVYNGEKAIETVDSDYKISLILMDIDLGKGMDGTEAAEEIQTKKDIPVVFLSSHTEPEVVEKTEGITSYGYIVKNSGETVILASIKMAFRLFDVKMKEKEKERLLIESKERYKRIFETEEVAIALSRLKDGVYIEANPRFETLTGYSYDEIVGHSSRDLNFMSSSYREEMASQLRTYGYLKNKELTFPTKQGEMRTILFSISKISLNDQDCLLAVMSDITERRKAEDQTENQNVFLSAVLDNIKEAIIICNEKGKIIRFNESARRLHGLPEKPIPPEQWAEFYDLYYPDGLTPLNTEDVPLYRALNGEDVVNIEIMVAPKDKEPHILSCNGHQIIDNEGKKVGAVVAMHDFTERKQAEEKLRLKSRFIDRIAEVSPDIFIIYNKDGEFLEIITAKEDNLFLKREMLMGSKISEVLPETAASLIMQGIDGALSTNSLKVVEYELEIENKSLYFEARIIPLEEDKVLAQIIEITERKQAEKALRESEKKNSAILDALPDLMFIIDCTGTYLDYYASNEYDLYVQPKRFIGQKMQDILPKEISQHLFPLIEKTLSTNEVQIGEYELTVSGENRAYEARFSTYDEDRVVAITRDITERRKLENQLKKNEERFKTIFYNSEVSLLEEDFSKVREIIENLKEKGVSDFYHYFDKNPNVVWDLAKKINVIDINDATLRLYGAKTKAEMLGSLDKTLYLTENTYDLLRDEFVAIAEKRTSVKGDMKTKSFYGKVIDITMSVYLSNEKDIKVVAINDITPYKKAIEEKEFLMKELNHRVKNNLAMVSSLINLKESETESDFSDLKSRIDVIKLVHEKLYQHNDIEHIEVKEYFQELLEAMFYSTSRWTVKIINNVEDISIPTKTAIPLGLVVNEIATNAVKYGFTDYKEARFSIDMRKDTGRKYYTLTLSNTGNPFPEEIGLENPETMGLQLISTLVAQLNGTVKLKKKPIPVFTIRFPIG